MENPSVHQDQHSYSTLHRDQRSIPHHDPSIMISITRTEGAQGPELYIHQQYVFTSLLKLWWDCKGHEQATDNVRYHTSTCAHSRTSNAGTLLQAARLEGRTQTEGK